MARIGESRDVYNFWRDNLRKRVPLEDLGVDGRIWKWVLKKKGLGASTGFTYLRGGTSGSLL